MLFRSMGEIRFRQIEEDDLELMQKLFNDEESNEYTTGWSFPVSLLKQREWFKNIINDSSTFRYIIENNEGESVGLGMMGKFDMTSRTAEASGLKLLPEFRSRGYMKSSCNLMLEIAFAELNMEMVTAVCHGGYDKVTASLKKMGFTLDGTLRKRLYKAGEYHALNHFSITRDEYIRYVTVKRLESHIFGKN